MRFDLYILQDVPFDTLLERCRVAEQLGFQAVHVADHSGDFRNLEGHWLDGWSVLAALAVRTEHVRLGTLVSNPILRHPSLLAREAIAVDQLSGGRLELGIGTGIAHFDHAAMGNATPWSARERAERFGEYVTIVDGILRDREFVFEGQHYATSRTPLAPGPAQRPRPPITVGGQAPTVRRIAAELADCWNTHGPFRRSADEIIAITAAQNQELDDRCRELGRDPRSLRRAALLYGPLNPWTSDLDARELVRRLADEAGIEEVVVFWPPDDDVDRLAALFTD